MPSRRAAGHHKATSNFTKLTFMAFTLLLGNSITATNAISSDDKVERAARQNVISEPSNFNKNSLHQQNAPGANIKHPPRPAHAAAAFSSREPTDDGHNGFHDKINTSNQRNEFNRRLETTGTDTATPTAAPPFLPTLSSLLKRSKRRTSSANESQRRFWEQHAHERLLLHRHKRYLTYPEGSSFQLIFDLIIAIVDWTNWAIMGITCAVSWELPSKPPSELLEELRTRVNDGTIVINRRNDSADQKLEYVATHQRPNQAQVSATVGAATSGLAMPVALVPVLPSYPYQLPQPSYYYAQPPQNYFDTGSNSQRKTFYAAATTGGTRWSPYQDEKSHGVSGTSGYAYADKQKHADWHQQQSGEDFADHSNEYYRPQQKQQTSHHRQGYAKWGHGHWWERNGQRLEDNWREKQHKWAKYENKFNSPTNYDSPYAYATPSPPRPRAGRTRKLLEHPPKHRIYPIFGKRRRRSRELHAFELKMEQIHLREHLKTRQKLYGKIEKLFKVRGHNGTACVLRALCETGQQEQHAPPQSFIMELLRAIFVLPKDVQLYHEEAAAEPGQDTTHSLDMRAHVPAHYWEAHAHAGDCAVRFSACTHSIWNDYEL